MKILIIDEMHLSIIDLLENEGHQVDYEPKISRSEILEKVADYHGLVIRSKTPMDRELLEKASQLQFIARAGAGLDQIDLEYLVERGIKLFHAAKGNRDAVAEHAIGGLLALFNHVIKADSEVRKGIWDREGNRGHELKGKTVGIMGYGNMGSQFAKRLKGFGVRVMAYDKYKLGFGSEEVEEVIWEKVKAEADVLSLHIPLTSETRNFFTYEELKSFSKPFWMINTARGEVISFEVLNRALDEGILKGAVLDVLENEKFKKFTDKQKEEFVRLAARDNVIFSPHVAGWTFESYEKINKVLVKRIKKAFN
ncbi:MAG TPA: phosphoglycerate dehydrogenase [Algoriphagus sp.]|jgi:D-3-phosphoglycerate dehydrogenase|uniref:2-hydroxyacid dehydrogenase n=1 Tax=unclassified Algoriphagus TaxID=2641541 RepID=UPI000C4A8994|nr:MULTISPECIES: 2-hydroxyacid dehydrogenase [unclassified Algoriphagus]MAL15555.1 phosphoglycerate dehydrogenase [Algoriphagus sp.]HAS59017.1 phosphoglycerate dehydrogenase [Algoriphagus sp.]HCB46576.1 phosphoglycerate dehydrogenase [Algoriphagus sp.]HCD86860.1 phosphoglycerate dehydrogenase [Algoriphagus sp.]HCH43880.1 phosphoglycerate dehydrogenase [Algoriphagus sp.]|tara:strand:- start:1362 stop:2291 length:930 start_codon:yes stop_codon:yes gene_type:complete